MTHPAIRLINQALLTPDLFRDWLAEFPQDHVIGTSSKCSFCPIAMFLQARPEIHSVLDGYSIIVLYGTCEVMKGEISYTSTHPRWADYFIGAVDRLPEHSPVTAGFALQSLDKAIARLKLDAVNDRYPELYMLLRGLTESPNQFREWLVSKAEDSTIIGYARQSCGCPVAAFLAAELKKREYLNITPAVLGDGRTEFRLDHNAGACLVKHHPEEWIAQFIDQVDREDAGTSISARVALSLLDLSLE